MAYITRELERKFLKLNDFFKVILVTGARQVGKTTMLKHLAGSDRTYVTMDNQAAANRMRYDRMVMEIARYDKSLPRMNPVSFVNHLCATYKVDSTSAIRRVQEVRAMKARKKY